MYILTNSDNVIKEISNTLEIQSDRYIVDGNRGIFKEYKTADIDGNITTDTISSFEVSIPEGIEAEKYCYTKKKGFYKNPDYVEYFSVEEIISALEDAVNELILGGM